VVERPSTVVQSRDMSDDRDDLATARRRNEALEARVRELEIAARALKKLGKSALAGSGGSSDLASLRAGYTRWLEVSVVSIALGFTVSTVLGFLPGIGFFLKIGAAVIVAAALFMTWRARQALKRVEDGD
jgi:hypothetical protein